MTTASHNLPFAQEKIDMKVCVIGTGYVVVTGACLAQIGHEVICVDNNGFRSLVICRPEMPAPQKRSLVKMASGHPQVQIGFTDDLMSKSPTIRFAIVVML